MSLLVQKYGGTSVGSVERIQAVAKRVHQTVQEGHQVVVVVSAMSGETNRLMALANDISTKPLPRELDVMISTGEQVTTALLCMALSELGQQARSYTGAQAGIKTDDVYNKARIVDINTEAVERDLASGFVVVVAGFQGFNEQGDVTTLGRGGSDTSAVAMAAALKADECRIYTDVDGVYTTDPRVVSDARKLDRITFEEMLEMSSLGSKVLQIRSVEFAGKYNVALRVLSSMNEGEGTLISLDEDNALEQALISGIAFNRNEAQITVRGVPDTPGIAYRILGAVADANIEVDMIVQNMSGDNVTDFTFTVDRTVYDEVTEIVNRVAVDLGAADVSCRNDIAKISVVGVGMRSHAGIASKMFEALAREQINILMISTSEIKISVVVDEKYLELGVRILHDEFDLAQK